MLILGVDRDLLARYNLPANGWGVLMFYSPELTNRWQTVYKRFAKKKHDSHRKAWSWWRVNLTPEDKVLFTAAARIFAAKTGNTEILERVDDLESAVRFEVIDAVFDVLAMSSSPTALFKGLVEFVQK